MRRRSGLTQEELSFLLGSGDASEVSRYEHNHKYPHRQALVASELLFGIQARDLYPGLYREIERGVEERVHFMYRVLQRRKRTPELDQKIHALIDATTHVTRAYQRRL